MSASSASGPASQGGFLTHMVQDGQTSPGSSRKREEKAPSVSVPPSRSETSASLTFHGTEQSQRPDLLQDGAGKAVPTSAAVDAAVHRLLRRRGNGSVRTGCRLQHQRELPFCKHKELAVYSPRGRSLKESHSSPLSLQGSSSSSPPGHAFPGASLGQLPPFSFLVVG